MIKSYLNSRAIIVLKPSKCKRWIEAQTILEKDDQKRLLEPNSPAHFLPALLKEKIEAIRRGR